jgi:hypothetical protein
VSTGQGVADASLAGKGPTTGTWAWSGWVGRNHGRRCSARVVATLAVLVGGVNVLSVHVQHVHPRGSSAASPNPPTRDPSTQYQR